MTKHLTVAIVILSLISFAAPIFAQPDTAYIKDNKDMLTVRVYGMYEAINLEISPVSNGPELIYRPNSPQHIGLAGFYKWFGLGLAIQTPIPTGDKDIYGSSSSVDLRINTYGSWINAELAYANYKGFYLENSPQIVKNFKNGDPYLQRPDLDISSISGIFYLVPNHRRHSFRAAYIQNEYQRKSAGSLLIAPAFQINHLQAQSSLIPDEYANQHEIFEEDKLVRGRFNFVGIFAGYSYSLVFLKRFYVNLALLPGAFLQYYDYHTETEHYNRNKAYFLWTSRFAAGYNGKKWFAGLGGVSGFNNPVMPLNTSAYALGVEQFRLWIGTRINIKK
ncbi:MAG: DUF4421 family protein [Bacteroidales bacterium]